IGQEGAELGGDAGTGSPLQDAVAQHALEQQCVVAQTAAVAMRGVRKLAPALQHRFPTMGKAIVDHDGGGDDRALVVVAPKAGRSDLDLDLVLVGDCGIGAVERTISVRRTSRAEAADCNGECDQKNGGTVSTHALISLDRPGCGEPSG